jgi:hypothetical protein
MANDSSGDSLSAPPPALSPELSVGGVMLLVLACLPYMILVGMLPADGDFPNEGGGEARMAWGFQQFWAYLACGMTLALLWLALWRASRSGGIAPWARPAVPFLVPVAGAVSLLAIAQSFEQPGPWLPLLPTLLPPAIAGYALWACLPVLSRSLPRAKVDAIAIGLIAALSLAVVPLSMLNASSYPGRLARHHAERAATDAAAQAAFEQRERELREKFARLGPDASLRDYVEARSWYLAGIDILSGERQVKSRQSDAVAMLNEGMILDLSNLWQLDLRPTLALCEAYGHALAAVFGRDERYRGSAYLSLLEGQFPNVRWLRDAHCDLETALAEIEARLAFMVESKDPSGAAANDSAAFWSRWGIDRETVVAARNELAGFRGAP